MRQLQDGLFFVRRIGDKQQGLCIPAMAFRQGFLEKKAQRSANLRHLLPKSASLECMDVRRIINGVENYRDETLRNGLGGSFTYCTLGEPIDEEGMLTGENLPTYEALADYIAYTATGNALTSISGQEDYCFGETDDIRFYLIYEPTLQFLESNKSALDGERAEQIAKVCKETGKKAYVYTPQKFVSQKELTDLGITFCQLPYNIGGTIII